MIWETFAIPFNRATEMLNEKRIYNLAYSIVRDVNTYKYMKSEYDSYLEK